MTRYKNKTASQIATLLYQIDQSTGTSELLWQGTSNSTCNPFPNIQITNPMPYPIHVRALYTSSGAGSDRGSEPMKPEDLLRYACMLGKRLLMAETPGYTSYITPHEEVLFEIKVVGFSPSYDYVKVQRTNGSLDWHNTQNYFKKQNRLVEVLNDDVSQMQDEQPSGDKTGKE